MTVHLILCTQRTERERERRRDFSAVLQNYNFYLLFFKISSGIKTERKKKRVKKANIIQIDYLRLFKVVKKEQLNLHAQSAFAIVGNIICKLHPDCKSHGRDNFSNTG